MHAHAHAHSPPEAEPAPKKRKEKKRKEKKSLPRACLTLSRPDFVDDKLHALMSSPGLQRLVWFFKTTGENSS